MSRPRHEYLLSVGSNIEPARWIPHALGLVQRRFEVAAISPLYDVAAEGAPGAPPFVNLAVRLVTDLPPRALREAARSIEALCLRVRTHDRNAPRTLDLDVVFGSTAWPSVHGAPDPELTQAGYVLVPCAVIWPDARDPETGRTLRDLADERFAGWDAAHRRQEDA